VSLREQYLAAQRRRAPVFAAVERCTVVDEPGVLGWAAPSGGAAAGRLWLDQPGTADELAILLDRFAPLVVTVDDDAAMPSILELLDRRPEFGRAGEPVTGMLLTPGHDLVIPPLPAGLEVRPVRRHADDDPDGVPLEDAAASCLVADPGLGAAFDVPGFAEHLRHAPEAELLAAVDGSGRVRGTAAASLAGGGATIYLVGTDPAWRGRGVASALTARVTGRAYERGAAVISLEASQHGRRLYERLGFRPATTMRSWLRGR
jgi:ribosomal protein S18 acetylase RimI-like enzyme